MKSAVILKRIEVAEQKSRQGTGGAIVIYDWTDEEVRMVKEATGETFSGGDYIQLINIQIIDGDGTCRPDTDAPRPLEELLKLWEQAENKNR